MTRTIMDEIKALLGPTTTSKIASAMLLGTEYPKLRAALEWSFDEDRKVRQALNKE